MDEHTKSLLQALIDGKQLECLRDGEWDSRMDYARMLHCFCHKDIRVKQPTIRIGEVDVPEPLRVAPADGKSYWRAQTTNVDLSYPSGWVNDAADRRWLNRGLVHLSEEAAIAHAKALIAVSGGTV